MTAQETEQSARRKPDGVPESSHNQGVRLFESEALLQGASQVLIRHGDTVYRLQRTKENKLILTK